MNRRSRLRRLLFQVHLWAGLALGIYAALIGVTGSVLVFHDEIVATISPLPTIAELDTPYRLEEIRAGIVSHYPGWHVWSLETPKAPGDAWRSSIQQGDTFRTVFADFQGRVVGELKSEGTWLRLVERFHSVLLIPRGRLLNGIGGLGLVVLAFSGLVLWWPTRGNWGTAFRIVRRTSWKGIIYDLHRIGGALVFGSIVLFGVTGGYFTWPAAYRYVTALVLPMTQTAATRTVPISGPPRPLDDLVAAARRAVPDTTFVRVILPAGQQEPATVALAHGVTPVDRSTRVSQVTVNASTGEVLAVDDFRNRRIGDHVLNWMAPLHGGHFAGLWLEVLWALAGLALPALFITGFLMWCNRVVAPKLGRSGR